MSFIGSMFGAKNTFTPNSAYAPGTQATTQELDPQIAAANANYRTADNGLQSLAQSLQQQAMGGGPNLANAQLQQATAQNVANQAALQGGQRGASANVGLMARQIGQQGANIQQQAVGQSAQNVLQQQLAAQQQLGGVLGTQGSLANQNLGIGQNALTAQNANISGNNANMNQVNADVAKQQSQQGQGLLSGLGGVAGGLIGGGALNSIFGGAASGAKNITPSGSAGQAYNPGTMYAAQGGMVPSQSNFHDRFLNKHTQHFANGGMTQPPSQMGGGMHFAPIDFKAGGRVPGKPQVQGNSPKNDTVPAMLSPEEIVIPNSITQSKDPVGQGAKFIEETLRKKLGSKKK